MKNKIIGIAVVLGMILLSVFIPSLNSSDNTIFASVYPQGLKESSSRKDVEFYLDSTPVVAGQDIEMVNIGMITDKTSEKLRLECSYFNDDFEVEYYYKERTISWLPFFHKYGYIGLMEREQTPLIKDNRVYRIVYSDTVDYKLDKRVPIMRVYYNSEAGPNLYCVVEGKTPYDFKFVPEFEWRETPRDEFPGLLCENEKMKVCFNPEKENTIVRVLNGDSKQLLSIIDLSKEDRCGMIPVTSSLLFQVARGEEELNYEYSLSECTDILTINLNNID